MKKKSLFTFVVIFTIALAGSYFSRMVSNQNKSPSEIQLANIEALSHPENPLPAPCNNVTGYRKWETSGNGVYHKEHFRDCCYKEKSGYNPTECI